MPPPTDAEKRALSNVASYVKPNFMYVSARELSETVDKKKRPEDKLKYNLLTPSTTTHMVYTPTYNSNGKREVKKALPRGVDV